MGHLEFALRVSWGLQRSMCLTKTTPWGDWCPQGCLLPCLLPPCQGPRHHVETIRIPTTGMLTCNMRCKCCTLQLYQVTANIN